MKVFSFKEDETVLDQFRTEAEKRKISVNQFLHEIHIAFLNKSDILPSITELDLQIKKEKLTDLQLKNRILAVRAVHFETFGCDTSSQAEKAIKNGIQKPRQTTWIGANYNSEIFPSTDVVSYVPSQQKSELRKHFCNVKNAEITLDIYKHVFCPHCGETI